MEKKGLNIEILPWMCRWGRIRTLSLSFTGNVVPNNFLIIFLAFLDFPYMIIEYVPHGDLLGYLRRSRGVSDCYYDDPDIKPMTNLTSEQMLKFAWQISDGMRYISSKKVLFIIYTQKMVTFSAAFLLKDDSLFFQKHRLFTET